MKISVIIPTFNEENTIIELLKRVKKQSDEGSNLEVIVVDDCSTDNSKKLLTEFSPRSKPIFKVTKLFEFSKAFLKVISP